MDEFLFRNGAYAVGGGPDRVELNAELFAGRPKLRHSGGLSECYGTSPPVPQGWAAAERG